MRTRILESKLNELFYLPGTQDIDIITNRDPNRLLERDKESYLKKIGGGKP